MLVLTGGFVFTLPCSPAVRCRYGISMHDLEDLVLHTVTFDARKNLYTLGIDS